MLEFCIEMHRENGVASLDMQKMIGAVQCSLAKYRGIVGIIDGDRGEVAASVCLVVAQWWYSADMHLEDRWTFVSEPYRRRPYARHLLDFAKQVAADMHLPLMMGVLSSNRTQAKVRLFERQLPLAGAVFMYNSPLFQDKCGVDLKD
jgi:GNAT superfamily N-acetyltransferase